MNNKLKLENLNMLSEISELCKERIEDYAERVNVALGKMDRYRIPIFVADLSLFEEIFTILEQYLTEHNKFDNWYESKYDIEDILFLSY